MDYVEVREARRMGGLRLALTKGVPGPWSQSAKSIFQIKGIPYTAVAQYGGYENADLVDWTGCRNAPVAVYEDQPPRSRWDDILHLAERLQSAPRLIPEAIEERIQVIGISTELCGEGGFGWCRRLAMLPPPHMSDAEAGDGWSRMRADYGGLALTAEEGARHCAGIMVMLAARLHEQARKGSRYLVGCSLSAADIYWACFSQIVRPLPDEVNPMPRFLRQVYAAQDPAIEVALDPILLDHRDYIYHTHLGLPLEF